MDLIFGKSIRIFRRITFLRDNLWDRIHKEKMMMFFIQKMENLLKVMTQKQNSTLFLPKLRRWHFRIA